MASLVEIGFVANTSGIQKADRDLKNLNKTGAQTDKEINSISKSVKVLGGALAALGVASLSRDIVQYSDTWKNVSSQLRQVTSSEQELIKTRTQLLKLTKDTRIGLTETVGLYSEMTRGTSELNLSSGQLMGITQTLNNLFVAGGKPISEVTGAIRQLNQGFASGVLRGDEFNSVAEGAPRIMEALAVKLKMTRGELREFAATGGITAEIMVSALSDYSDTAQKLADMTEKTFGQSMTNATTNIIEFVGELDSVNSVVGGVGQGIEGLTGELDGLKTSLEDWATQWQPWQKAAEDAIEGTSDTFRLELIALGAITDETLKFMGAAVLNFPSNIMAMAKIVAVELAHLVDVGLAHGKGFAEVIGISLANLDQLPKIYIGAFVDLVVNELNTLVEKSKVIGLQIKDALNPFDGDTFDFTTAFQDVTNSSQLATETILTNLDAQILANQQLKNEMVAAALDGANSKIQAAHQARESTITDVMLERDAALSAYDAIRAKQKRVVADFKKEPINLTSTTKGQGLSKEDAKELAKLTDEVNNFGGAWSKTGSIIADTFGSIADGLDDYASQMNNIISLEERLQTIKSSDTATIDEKRQATASLAQLEEKRTRAELSGLATIAGTTSKLFDEQSKEREALHKAEQVFTAIEIGLALQKAAANALTAITSAFAAPFPVGFAAGAAMIGIMAGLGVFSGSSGGSAPSAESLQASQGTGTLMGSDDKSQSIVNALEEYNDIGTDQLSELIGIRQAMTSLSGGIAQLAVSLVSSNKFGGGSVGNLGETKAYNGNLVASGGKFIGKVLGGVFGVLEGALATKTINTFGDPLGDLVDRFLGNFSKTNVKLLDTGLQFSTQELGDLIANGVLDATYYNVVETTKRKFWGLSKKTSQETQYSAIEQPIADEFTRIFEYLGAAVQGSLDVLGVSVIEGLVGPQLSNSIDDFVINLPNLSFKDMDGDQIQSELEAIFSQQGDLLAEFVLPGIKDYQEMGEGAFETLSRVAREQAVFNDAIDYMGISLGSLSNMMRVDVAQSVIDLMGGLEEFSSATSSYVKNFFSDAEQTEMLGKSLTDVFSDLELPLATTQEEFRAIVESLDLTTESGQATFATLMTLNPALAEYIDALDKQREALIETANIALDAVESAINLEKDRAATILSGAQANYEAEVSRIEGVRRAIEQQYETLVNNLSTATDGLTASFDAEKASIQSLSDIRIQGLTEELNAIQSAQSERLSSLNSEKSAIKSAQSERLRGLNKEKSALSSTANSLLSLANKLSGAINGSATTKQALDAAQRGDFSLAQSLDTNQVDSNSFGDASSLAIAQAIEKSRIGAISDLASKKADQQLSLISSIERSISSTNANAQLQTDLISKQLELEKSNLLSQTDAINAQIEAERENAASQIAALDAQLNSLLGVDTNVLSLEEATRAYQSAKLSLDSFNYDAQLASLANQEEIAMQALDIAQLTYDSEVSRLDALLADSTAQLNAALNIDTSVMTVNESIINLGNILLQLQADNSANNSSASNSNNILPPVIEKNSKIEETNSLMLQSIMKDSRDTKKYMKEIAFDGISIK